MKKYEFKGNFYNENELDSLAGAVSEEIDEEYFDDFLNEVYPEIEICGCEYLASHALYTIDRIAYNCSFNDWTSNETDDILNILEGMADGDEQEIYGNYVNCCEVFYICSICGTKYDTEEEMNDCYEDCKEEEETE